MIDAAELERFRASMGPGVMPLLRGGPRPWLEARADGWVALSGCPSADLNMVHAGSPGAVAALEEAVRLHAGPGLPILYTLAEGVDHRDFEQALEFLVRLPFMGIDLRSASLEADLRVQRAAPADLAAVDDLMSKAFELPEGLLHDPLERLLADGGKQAGIWMLRQQGVPVSCVLTSVVDDLVTVWCMSTPPAHARKGFGRALLGHAMLQAREAGCRTGLLSATPTGEPLYLGMGWSILEYWGIFAKGGAAHPAGQEPG